MSQEIQLRQPEYLPDVSDPFARGDRDGAPAESIFSKAHRVLRGRYKWCIPLSAVLAAAGAFAGFKSARPMYLSTGMIHVKPYIRPIGPEQTPETGTLPFFDQFMQAQGALMTSQRALDMALDSDEWKKLGRRNTDEELANFRLNLAVKVPTRSEIITISFRDESAAAASAAVKAIMDAHWKIYVETEMKLEERRRRVLDERRLTLTTELKSKQDLILQIAREYGTDDLRALHSMWMAERARVNQLHGDATFALSGLIPPTTRPTTGPAQDDLAKLSVAEIALRDPTMRQMQRELKAAQEELEVRLKAGPNHPRLAEMRQAVASKQREVEDYAEEFRLINRLAAQGATATDPRSSAAAISMLSPERLKAAVSRYEQQKKEIDATAMKIGLDMLKVDGYQREAVQIREDLDLIKKRIEQIDLETPAEPLTDRIQRVSFGERPAMEKDKRPLLAMAGGMGGVMVGFAAAIVVGLMDRRLRNAEDASRGSAAAPGLLGVLPSLPEDLSDPEQAAIAAHCVHQIRTLLQIGSSAQEHRVFAITSPAAGTGKTSLSLSLGVSFAAANSRTLLIDCDIVGGGLTARVEAIVRRKIGQVLRREGLVTHQQLEMAMKVAQNSKKKLGEILVDLGFLTQADVAKALSLQEERPMGLLDALSGEELEECVADTGIRGLSILPLGAAMPNDVSKLSPNLLRRLIERARGAYDTVLIDTGPIPGSLEASVVAAAADGVVMVVSRGEHRPLAERSLGHLRQIGAHVSGMVFNRAEGRDMNLATTTNRLSSFDRGGRVAPVESEIVAAVESPRFGPMAMAVAGKKTGRAKHDDDRHS